ncbi:unnamed protein product [Amoebophrya sp. A25]|nr:unnamed protein product [Amoebophrya sp. A25]|eukprot:GSA25T00009802001.1
MTSNEEAPPDVVGVEAAPDTDVPDAGPAVEEGAGYQSESDLAAPVPPPGATVSAAVPPGTAETSSSSSSSLFSAEAVTAAASSAGAAKHRDGFDEQQSTSFVPFLRGGKPNFDMMKCNPNMIPVMGKRGKMNGSNTNMTKGGMDMMGGPQGPGGMMNMIGGKDCAGPPGSMQPGPMGMMSMPGMAVPFGQPHLGPGGPSHPASSSTSTFPDGGRQPPMMPGGPNMRGLPMMGGPKGGPMQPMPPGAPSPMMFPNNMMPNNINADPKLNPQINPSMANFLAATARMPAQASSLLSSQSSIMSAAVIDQMDSFPEADRDQQLAMLFLRVMGDAATSNAGSVEDIQKTLNLPQTATLMGPRFFLALAGPRLQFLNGRWEMSMKGKYGPSKGKKGFGKKAWGKGGKAADGTSFYGAGGGSWDDDWMDEDEGTSENDSNWYEIWEKHATTEGLVYFKHTQSGECVWVIPTPTTPVNDQERAGGYSGSSAGRGGRRIKTVKIVDMRPRPGESEDWTAVGSTTWLRVKTSTGLIFYHDKETGTSQWEQPLELAGALAELDAAEDELDDFVIPDDDEEEQDAAVPQRARDEDEEDEHYICEEIPEVSDEVEQEQGPITRGGENTAADSSCRVDVEMPGATKTKDSKAAANKDTKDDESSSVVSSDSESDGREGRGAKPEASGQSAQERILAAYMAFRQMLEELKLYDLPYATALPRMVDDERYSCIPPKERPALFEVMGKKIQAEKHAKELEVKKDKLANFRELLANNERVQNTLRMFGNQRAPQMAWIVRGVERHVERDPAWKAIDRKERERLVKEAFEGMLKEAQDRVAAGKKEFAEKAEFFLQGFIAQSRATAADSSSSLKRRAPLGGSFIVPAKPKASSSATVTASSAGAGTKEDANGEDKKDAEPENTLDGDEKKEAKASVEKEEDDGSLQDGHGEDIVFPRYGQIASKLSHPSLSGAECEAIYTDILKKKFVYSRMLTAKRRRQEQQAKTAGDLAENAKQRLRREIGTVLQTAFFEKLKEKAWEEGLTGRLAMEKTLGDRRFQEKFGKKLEEVGINTESVDNELDLQLQQFRSDLLQDRKRILFDKLREKFGMLEPRGFDEGEVKALLVSTPALAGLAGLNFQDAVQPLLVEWRDIVLQNLRTAFHKYLQESQHFGELDVHKYLTSGMEFARLGSRISRSTLLHGKLDFAAEMRDRMIREHIEGVMRRKLRADEDASRATSLNANMPTFLSSEEINQKVKQAKVGDRYGKKPGGGGR